MKNVLLSAAVAAVLSGVAAPSHAASSPDDIAQIREQLQTLMQRVDKLEQENTELKTENEELKSQTDYLRSETKGVRKDMAQTQADVAKAKGTDWASKVSVKGDFRYRYEMISDETTGVTNGVVQPPAADRYRDRIRARVNIEAKATDNLLVGIGMATTENGDPRSSNATLDGTFSRKSLDLDLAYFDWKFASWGNLLGGKMKQPFVKPGQSLFWDGDVNPEGLAVAFNRGIWFGSGYYYWVDEVSGVETTRTSDTMLAGGQFGARLPIGSSTLMLAAHYYDLISGQGRAPFYNNSSNGNTTVGGNLLYDYEVINLSADWTMMLGAVPLQIWADVAENQDPDDLNTAWAAGALLGKASNYRTWEIGAFYQLVEKDALFGQLIDSDFGSGLTDSEGWVVKAGYAPLKNWTLNATYFMNKRNVDVANSAGQTEVDYDRLQVDFNVKF